MFGCCLLLTPVSSLLRLRDNDRRLHDFHQRIDLYRQLPAHQPPHCVRPAQPLQLLRPDNWGVGRVMGRINYFFSINMSSLNKIKCFFANSWSSPGYCWEWEDLVGWGVCLGGLKENTGVLFFKVNANSAGFPLRFLFFCSHHSCRYQAVFLLRFSVLFSKRKYFHKASQSMTKLCVVLIYSRELRDFMSALLHVTLRFLSVTWQPQEGIKTSSRK